jgi:hypothetical protein
MTLTTKDPSITLCAAEQIELRRFMNNPNDSLAVVHGSTGITNILMKSLAEKGYIELVETKEFPNGVRFDYYQLKADEV